MQPILAHKGKLNLNVTVRGLTGHSSDPAKGVNAVHAAGEAIALVAAEARRLAAEGPFEDGFDPPHTTIHVGTVQGGSILNIIPDHAAFDMEWRHIPGDSPYRHMDRLRSRIAATIEPAMKAMRPECGFSYEIRLEMPGMELAADHALTDAVKQVTGANSTGKVSYGTEGGFFERAGIATIICGPGAHRPGAPARRMDRRIRTARLRPFHPRHGRSAFGLIVATMVQFTHPQPPPLPDFKVRLEPAGYRGLDRRQYRRPRHRHPRLGRPGPHVALLSLIHGNEIAGAIVLDRLLRAGLTPTRGKLSFGFVNLAAFDRFDPVRPTASRFLDEDLNRVWDEADAGRPAAYGRARPRPRGAPVHRYGGCAARPAFDAVAVGGADPERGAGKGQGPGARRSARRPWSWRTMGMSTGGG